MVRSVRRLDAVLGWQGGVIHAVRLLRYPRRMRSAIAPREQTTFRPRPRAEPVRMLLSSKYSEARALTCAARKQPGPNVHLSARAVALR